MNKEHAVSPKTLLNITHSKAEALWCGQGFHQDMSTDTIQDTIMYNNRRKMVRNFIDGLKAQTIYKCKIAQKEKKIQKCNTNMEKSMIFGNSLF